MKVCLVLIASCLVFSASIDARAQTTYYYNSDGTRIGTSQPNTTAVGPGVVKERYYNTDGNPVGYSTQTGVRTYYYNNKSERVGTSDGKAVQSGKETRGSKSRK